MIKLIYITVAIFSLLLQQSFTLNEDEYIDFIEKISQDEQILEEYAKWSFELFSQPDYLYGPNHGSFPCPAAKDTNVPTSVHALRPSDLRCVGAMGDSLTAALGAHAITPVGLLFENRGVSWSVGGDQTYSKVLSVPNALKQYYKDIKGYSTKVSMMIGKGQNATHNGLNVAKSGDRSIHLAYQAELIIDRLKNEKLCDWDNDWKLITLFVGGNDLCSFCEDPTLTTHTPERYLSYVRDAIDKLYFAPIPRVLVNLVLVLDARGVEELNSGGFICRLFHNKTCPCAAFPTPQYRSILADYVPRYQQALLDLAASNRYDGRDDFTVVAQPFLSKTQLPYKSDHTIDFSYFAPDCFHFSGKGHAQAALSLWNNMLEPVGAKQTAWHMGETLKCPTDEFPYIFTKKNSAKALELYLNRTTTAVPAPEKQTDKKPGIITEGTEPTTSAHHHKHPKHHKSKSSWTKSNFAILAGGVFLLVLVLLLAITKRENIRLRLHGAGRRHFNGFTKPQTLNDNDDDVEIWSRSGGKSSVGINSSLPKSHGTRVVLE